MKKSIGLMTALLLGLSACSALGANNHLADSLTPTAPPAPSVASALPTPTDLAAIAPGNVNLQPQLAGIEIPLDEIVTLLPPDAIPAIRPEDADGIMVSAEAANQAGLEPVERVIGVDINGESRAYPLPFLSRHEIVNTEVGGRQIAVTW